MNGETSAFNHHKRRASLWILLILLGGSLTYLCRQGLKPNGVFFANDVSLGAMMDSSDRLPGTFRGHWQNLEFLGADAPGSTPTLTSFLETVFPPAIYMKIYAPVTMLVLGFGAWLLFRQLGFSPGVCVVGGLSAGLNMHYFSNACWGLGQWDISAGMIFIALAVVVSPEVKPLWVKGALAGLCIGMNVMEGFDAGAILSIYAGIFIVFYLLTQASNPLRAIPRVFGTGVVMIFFALVISSSTIYTLIGSTFTENASTGVSDTEKKEHWIFLTTYSLPKLESLKLIIPGVFGYRMMEFMTDTNKSSAYWGGIAEDFRVAELESGSQAKRAEGVADLGLAGNPAISNLLVGPDTPSREQIMDSIKSQLPRRHSGSGDYVGQLVVLLSFFGLFNTWRGKGSPFSKSEREAIWFWAIAAILSLMVSWGRYGDAYQFIAPLPFLRNIRNPIKFLHPMNVCFLILAGYGMEALHRLYMAPEEKPPPPAPGAPKPPPPTLWQKLSGFDVKWIIGSLVALGAAVFAFWLLHGSKKDLVHHIVRAGFPDDQAAEMAKFSIDEVLWFVIFFTLSVLMVLGIVFSLFRGRRSWLAWGFFAVITIVDICHADEPWVRIYDWKDKYSLNPVTDFLRHEPWEHRVVSARRSVVQPIYDLSDNGNFGGVLHFWLENDYMANNIESLEVDQAPRLPDLERNYLDKFNQHSGDDYATAARMWRLTNTRYILCDVGHAALLNQVVDPKDSFHMVMRFDLTMKPGHDIPEDAGDLTIVTNQTGSLCLLDYTQALPRAKLYANWQEADDTTTLDKLADLNFDISKTVLVSSNTPVGEKPGQPDADPGSVNITSYSSRDIHLQADARTPAVLLYNERFGDHWHVWVDRKRVPILRCNYIDRGVFVPPGSHTIEFRFQPPLKWLLASAGALTVGLVLAGYVAVNNRKPEAEEAETPKKSGKDKKNKGN